MTAEPRPQIVLTPGEATVVWPFSYVLGNDSKTLTISDSKEDGDPNILPYRSVDLIVTHPESLQTRPFPLWVAPNCPATLVIPDGTIKAIAVDDPTGYGPFATTDDTSLLQVAFSVPPTFASAPISTPDLPGGFPKAVKGEPRVDDQGLRVTIAPNQMPKEVRPYVAVVTYGPCTKTAFGFIGGGRTLKARFYIDDVGGVPGDEQDATIDFIGRCPFDGGGGPPGFFPDGFGPLPATKANSRLLSGVIGLLVPLYLKRPDVFADLAKTWLNKFVDDPEEMGLYSFVELLRDLYLTSDSQRRTSLTLSWCSVVDATSHQSLEGAVREILKRLFVSAASKAGPAETGASPLAWFREAASAGNLQHRRWEVRPADVKSWGDFLDAVNGSGKKSGARKKKLSPEQEEFTWIGAITAAQNPHAWRVVPIAALAKKTQTVTVFGIGTIKATASAD
jgi:hypothetical protein